MRMTEAEIRAMLAPKPKIPRVRHPKVTEEGYPCLAPVKLTLPWCPLNNRTWRNVGGHTVLSKASKDYRAHVAQIVTQQWPQGVLKPFSGRLVCIIMAYAPDKRRYDIDNVPKQVLDALQRAGVFLDDWQFDGLHVHREAPKEGGEIVVTIGPRRLDD